MIRSANHMRAQHETDFHAQTMADLQKMMQVPLMSMSLHAAV